ncbi:NFACT RNA binding domain-containing protein [Campylobacter anatolicus]|nr:NFACT RNA binding domain-containing protein [Campylobacter anatolicus]
MIKFSYNIHMKYAHLRQIETFLSKFKKITSIKRSGDMVLCINFDSESCLFFDLSKSSSAIYTNPEFMQIKEYKAPFDIALKKRFNASKILSIKTLENNRIMCFECELSGSYKSEISLLYLEFTGRFTNAIITDKNGIIIEALRHIDNSFRVIKPGKNLIQLAPIVIKEKIDQPISDFKAFFKDEFERINTEKLISLKLIKIAQIERKIGALQVNLDALENENKLREQADLLSLKAEVLLANLSNIKEYEREFELKDFNGKKIKFSLNESPKMAANSFFTHSKRLRQKAAGVINERENLNKKIRFNEGLLNLVKNATSVSEFEILMPKQTQSIKQKNADENVQNFFIADYKIAVGKNEKGNETLLKNANKNDIWLHIKDIPSAHVIIKTNKAKLSDEVLNYAAKICLNFSVSGAGRYAIDYTKRENVRIISGGHVNYINYKTIVLTK